MSDNGTTERVFVDRVILNGDDWNDVSATAIRAGVFGELVKVAARKLDAYHSDLFHDADYLTRRLGPKGLSFFYVVRDSGTHVVAEDAEADLLPDVRRQSPDADAYRVDVTVGGRHGVTWRVRVTQLD